MSLLKTIDSIIEQIFVHNKITPICKKSIFKRQLLKLITDCKFNLLVPFIDKLIEILRLADPYLVLLVTYTWLYWQDRTQQRHMFRST